MSITVSVARGAAYPVGGGRKFHPTTFTPDTSYPSGGYTLTPGKWGARVGAIEGVIPQGGDSEGGQFDAVFDSANVKLRFYRGSQRRTFAPGGGDIKGATNLAGTEGNADQNATAVNGALLKAATTFTVLAGTITPTTQPDIPRNIVIQIENDSGGGLDLYEGVTTFAITGTDVNGVALTESVTLTSTSGNKAVANTKFRFVQGSKAFKTVTSVAITNAPAGALKGSLGVGTRVGLPAKLANAVYTDVTKITVSAANVAPSATVTSAGGVDTTNNTVNVGTIADAADVGITYTDSGEVAVGEDISAAVFKAIVITKT